MVRIHDPHEDLLQLVENAGSQPRLSELRDQWEPRTGFDSAVISAVEHGEIRLYPLGTVVKVKRESEPGRSRDNAPNGGPSTQTL